MSLVGTDASGLLREVPRFAVVGAAATALHVAGAALAFQAGATPLAANGLAFVVAFTLSWAGHAFWTFRDLDGRSRAASLWRFALVSLLALALGQALVWALVERGNLPFAWGLAAVVLAVPATTFAGARLWAFAPALTRGTLDAVSAALVILAAVAWQASQPLNHDVAWLLTGAERLLDGGTFGRDVEDVTPPWAWWLLMPIAALVRAGLDASLAVALGIGGLAATALLLARPLVARPLLIVLALAMVLPAGYGWAQREHIMAVAALPYILLCARRAAGGTVAPSLAMAAALLAALGLLQKPHFVLVPLTVEVWLLLQRRSPFRPETWTLGVAGLLYVAAAWVFAGPWFTDVLPDMMVAYGAYGGDTPKAVVKVATAVALPLLVWLAFARENVHAQALAVASAGAGLAAVLQGKGWAYHLIPTVTFAILAAAFAIRERAATGPREALQDRHLASCAAVSIVAFVAAQTTLSQAITAPQRMAQTDALARAIGNGTVMAFNTSPRLVHPAVRRAGAHWTGIAGNMHYVPAAVAGTSDEARALGRRQSLAVLARMETAPPDVLLVDENAKKLALPAGHDWLAWMRSQAPERSSRLLALYRDEGLVSGFRVFRKR